MHVNFNENYDNRQQHAIQSASFGYQQFSLYAVMIYYKGGLKKIVIVTPDKDQLEDAEFNVKMHTESSSSIALISAGSWYTAYLSKYKYWLLGRILETSINSIHKMSIDSEEIKNIPKACNFYQAAD